MTGFSIQRSASALAAGLCAFAIAACAGPNVEPNVSAAPADAPSRFVSLENGERLNVQEAGEGSPHVVLLHGIPTSNYMWRNVLPGVAETTRVSAPDLPGYGASDLPADGDYSYDALYERFAEYMDGLDGPLVLVVNDLGSVMGLDYAERNRDRIAGIVLVEAIYMPFDDWRAQLGLQQRMMFTMFGNDAIARFMLVNRPRVQSMFMNMGTARTLEDEIFDAYLAPYEDRARREVVLQGPGPATINGIKPIVDRYAAWLAQTDTPILLVTADPGFITRQPAIRYAEENFDNLTVTPIGDGAHFLPEDQPTALTSAIVEWLGTLD